MGTITKGDVTYTIVDLDSCLDFATDVQNAGKKWHLHVLSPGCTAVDADHVEALAFEAAAIEVFKEALPFGGTFAGRQMEVDDLLLAVGPETQGHQHRPADGAGAGLAGEHYAIEHQGGIACLRRPAVEGLDRHVQRPGHPAHRRGAHLLAENGEQHLAHLAGRKPQNEGGQDHPVELRG